MVDLKPLNTFLQKQKFKMTTLKSVIQEVEKGDSFDLVDAYFDIPIHPTCWKFLRFPVETEMYEYGMILRNNIGPQCVYLDDGSCSRTCPEGNRPLCISRPGRLLGQRQGAVVLDLQVTGGDAASHAQKWSAGEFGEVGVGTNTRCSPHMSETPDGHRNSQYNQTSVSLPRIEHGEGQIFSTPVRFAEQCNPSSQMGRGQCSFFIEISHRFFYMPRGLFSLHMRPLFNLPLWRTR